MGIFKYVENGDDSLLVLVGAINRRFGILYKEADGCYVFCPYTSITCFSGHVMRELADKLAELNTDHDAAREHSQKLK